MTVANFGSDSTSRPSHEVRGGLRGQLRKNRRVPSRRCNRSAATPQATATETEFISFDFRKGSSSDPGPSNPSLPSDAPPNVLFDYKARCFTGLRLNMLQFCALPCVPPLCNRPLWPPFRSSTQPVKAPGFPRLCSTTVTHSVRLPKYLSLTILMAFSFVRRIRGLESPCVLQVSHPHITQPL